VGTHPRFVEMIRQLVLERLQGAPVLSVGPLPAPATICAPGCCPRPERPAPRGPAAPADAVPGRPDSGGPGAGGPGGAAR
jgi:ferrochelatase